MEDLVPIDVQFVNFLKITHKLSRFGPKIGKLHNTSVRGFPDGWDLKLYRIVWNFKIKNIVRKI